MYLFVILTVLTAAFGVAMISYFVNVGQIDTYFKRLAYNTAENFASLVDADFLNKVANAAETDEYQELRQQAEDAEDDTLVEEYFKREGLWDQYIETRDQIDNYLEHMDDIKYLYIVRLGEKYAEYDMYVLDDSENPVSETGYYEEREEELAALDPYEKCEPTISNGDWGWLCSAYAPVYLEDGTLVCHIGCDVGMEDIMRERRTNLIYVLISAVSLTVLILIFAVIFARKAVIRPLRTLTADIAKFKPAEGISYDEAGVLPEKKTKTDEIGDIYTGIRSMEINIIDYLTDLSTMQKDKEKAESDVRDKEKLIGEISKEAYRDSLTSVGNKSAYYRRVEELKTEIADGKTDFAIVVVDINELKRINDNYGHNAGDLYIKGCCHMICETFKHSPVFRIGGDEFVVIVLGDDYRDRIALFAKLRRSFEESYSLTDCDPWMRYSAASGMAEYASDDNMVELVFKRADKAMYEHKLKFKEKHGIKR